MTPPSTGNTLSESITVENTPATATSVSISPSSPFTTNGLSCSYAYNDVDGHTNASTIEWSVSASQTGSGTVVGTGSSLASNKFVRDQWVTCTVTPNDGVEDGTPQTDQVQIQNSVPSVANATITPSTPTASTPSLTCNYAYTDADSDPDRLDRSLV